MNLATRIIKAIEIEKQTNKSHHVYYKLTTTDSKLIFTQQGAQSASSQTTRFHILVIKFFFK